MMVEGMSLPSLDRTPPIFANHDLRNPKWSREWIANPLLVGSSPTRRSNFGQVDGIGIHARLKPVCPAGLEGSSPSLATKF